MPLKSIQTKKNKYILEEKNNCFHENDMHYLLISLKNGSNCAALEGMVMGVGCH